MPKREYDNRMRTLLIIFLLSLSALINTSFYLPTANKAASENTAIATNLKMPTPAEMASQQYFGKVLDISPSTIVGNFGEPRKAHFHTGLDFRTNQEEGHVIFAAAGGYISRINVSGAGYGNALYITHPNGYVTVYAHLREFHPKIIRRLRKEQYDRESFSVDFILTPNELPVSKGDTIALSGNTGGSGGPHLHFEIRDTLEKVYNPLLFGYKLKDNMKPVVGYLKFYPLDSLKYRCDGYRVRPILKEGIYQHGAGTIKLNSKSVGFSVNAYDVMNLTDAHTGIYNMTVFEGNKMIYDARFDKLDFNEKRYVCSHTDYKIFMTEGRKAFHKCFVEPGNKCNIYSNVLRAGEIDLTDGKEHHIVVEVTDYNGNISQIKMVLKYDPQSVVFKAKPLTYTTRFDYDHDNDFSNSSFSVHAAKGCLFDNMFLTYTTSKNTDSFKFSDTHILGSNSDYLFDWVDVSVRAENLPSAMHEKALLTVNGSALGGKFENGFVKSRTRELGSFVVKIDTTPPKVSPLNITQGRDMRQYRKITLRITDNLSGISDFDTYIDGQWVVTEYDAKTAQLTHWLDMSMLPGEHIFSVIVRDEKKNQNQYSVKFLM